MKYVIGLFLLMLVGCGASGSPAPACPEGEYRNHWGFCIEREGIDENKNRAP